MREAEHFECNLLPTDRIQTELRIVRPTRRDMAVLRCECSELWQ